MNCLLEFAKRKGAISRNQNTPSGRKVVYRIKIKIKKHKTVKKSIVYMFNRPHILPL